MGSIKQFFSFLTVLLIINTFNILNATALTLPAKHEIPTIDNFIGNWEMKTIVTHSSCSEIIIGSTTESRLLIERGGTLPQGNTLQGLWDGGIWTTSKSTITPLNGKEALTERTTQMKLDSDNVWKAELVDHLYLEDENIMHSESIVKQYKNSTLIGEYKTFSILIKID